MKCFLGISNFLEEISSFYYSIFFPLFTCIVHLRKLSYLSLLFYATLHLVEYIFPFWASLVAHLLKNLLAIRRPGFNPWVGKIPWKREWLPAPVFWPGQFQGLYSPWGHKESDVTEQLSLSAYFHFQGGENLYMFRESVKSAIGNIKEVSNIKFPSRNISSCPKLQNCVCT